MEPLQALPALADIRHVLVVDDHAVVRLGIAQLLRQLQPGLTVSDAASLAQCEAALAARPDIELVVLDVHLPDVPRATPLWGLRRLRQQHPLLAVAMLSADPDADLAGQALREGAAGWLPKSAEPRVLASALTLVLQGGCYLPPYLLQRERQAPTEVLSERQLDVLTQLVDGRSNKEIARALGLAESTVKTHLVAIFRVLKVANRTQAVISGRAQLRALPPAH
jgi:DNA-binding NarL/FixJ family response regulator